MKNEKQMRRFEVPCSIDWLYGVDTKKLREDLDELEKMGVNEIYIESESDFGGGHYINIRAFENRLETNDEQSTRIQEEKRKAEEQKNRDMETIAQIKQKYNL